MLLSISSVQTHFLAIGLRLRLAARPPESARGHHALCAIWAKSPPKSKSKLKSTLTWTTAPQVRTLTTNVMMKMTKLTPLSLPSHRQKLAASSWRLRRLLKTPKRLASALTPRHAQSRATMMSWAKPKPIKSTSFREPVGPFRTV
jgi:hypothetical protein